ncbi:MAG: N-acetylmuramoyl-L-alanine amidase [Salaquimonas sp.]
MIEKQDTALKCELRPAVNFNERKVEAPDILLLHYTGMQDCDAAVNWLCMEESQVSCHYLVREDGRIVQMVSETNRAWHAGKGSWRGADDINSRSIGIEICNPGHQFGYVDFPDVQIQSVIGLCKDILQRNVIDHRNVLAHSDIAPGRKQDPGEKFPWEKLSKNGVGHWIDPTPISGGRFFSFGDQGEPVEALQSMLALYGYNVDINGVFDEQTQKTVSAFQQHFRQERTDGVADASTIDTLYRLISALAVS